MNTISELENFLERARVADGNDMHLVAIMSDMEQKYNIPALAIGLEKWIANTKDSDQILDVYRRISRMRNI